MNYFDANQQNRSVQANTRIAKIRHQLRSIHIDYQPQLDLLSSLDFLMQCVELGSDDIFPGLRCFASEGAGKSYIAKNFADAVNRRYPDQKRVVYFSLKTAKTNKSVLLNLVEKIGSDRWKPKSTETIDRLESMLKDIIVANKTQLFMFDELGNVEFKNSFNTEFCKLVKTILNENWAAVALLGTPDGWNVIKHSRELLRRIKRVSDFPRLRNTAEDIAFVQAAMVKIDAQIQAWGILTGSSCFISADTVLGLIEVSGGGLGYIIDIIKEGVEVAVRRGRDEVREEDLALAVDQWLVANGLISSNPFRSGALI